MTETQNPNPNSPELTWDRVYGDPENTGKKLISTQGVDSHYLGTCGIVSCANVLRLAGQTTVTESALRYHAQCRNLCRAYTINESASPDAKVKTALENGMTLDTQRQTLLEDYDLHSELEDQNVIQIAKRVIAGHGVICSVYAGRLWQDNSYYNAHHAVTVIGVKKSASGGQLLGFYICDSGRSNKAWDQDGNEVVSYEMDQARYYTWQELRAALTERSMNVTKEPIRLKGGDSR